MRSPLLVVCVLALLVPSAAFAAEPLGTYRLPPPLPPERPAAPEREPDDVPRRHVETIAVATVGALGCAGDAPRAPSTPDPCAHLSPATGVGLALLYRPVPLLALGAEGAFERFGWDASHGIGDGEGRATWTSASVLARGYFLDSGAIDAWFGAAVGGGWLSLEAAHAGQTDQLWRNGVRTTGSIGVDAWMTSHLRVGVFGALAWQPGSRAERCSLGTCLDASDTIARIPDHVLRAGLALTFATGDEL